MTNAENARTRADAISEAKARRTSGASRNRFWAGLNRYLETEAEHGRKATKQDHERKAAKQDEEEPRQQKRSAG